MEWLVKHHEAAFRRAIATEVSIPLCNKGKRKIVNNMEEEKSYNF